MKYDIIKVDKKQNMKYKMYIQYLRMCSCLGWLRVQSVLLMNSCSNCFHCSVDLDKGKSSPSQDKVNKWSTVLTQSVSH